MEREKWAQVLANARTQQRDGLDNFIKAIEETVGRATQLCSQYESFGQRLEDALHTLQQQQQQPSQQQQQPQNPMLNPGLGGDNGAGPQVPWNIPGAQNPSLNAQTPMQNQQMMNAAQNRIGANPPNYNLGGANPATTFPQNLQALQNHPGNRPPGANMPPNAAQNQNDLVKANFSKFLATVNIDPVIHLAGRTIEMWALFHAVKEFDTRFGRDNPAKFRLIGYQLGLPPDGQQTQTSVQAANILQECYNRLTAALRIAGSNTTRPPGQQPPTQTLMQTSQAQNEMWLQQIKPSYPRIDFNNFPRDWITNLPLPRFQESLKKWIEQQSMQGAGNVPNLPIGQPPVPPVQVNRNPTPVSDPNMAGPSAPMANRPVSDAMEIQKLHETFKQRWRLILQNTNKAPVQPPPNLQVWKEQLRNAFTAAKVIVSRLGLYGHLFKDLQAVHKVMQMSAYLVKQLQQPNLIILSQADLESMTQWLQQQAQSLIQRIKMLQVTPELRPFIHPTETETNTLGGFLPQPLPPMVQSVGPTPSAMPHQPHVQSHASTPHQASMPTPASSMPAPTPPASTPAQTGMVPPSHRGRRFGISEPSSETKPNNLSTPPASTSAAAHTSPATPASPPKGKPVRKMPKPRKPSKAGDTPTPVAEPATTPTPVATTSHKRPLDEAETPASQAEAPQLKRPKTEPINPPVPVKAPTPPSVLSAPVDRAAVKTEEGASALLAESFKKAEETDTGMSSQTQFIDWITQLVSNPTPTPSAPSLVTTETQISVTTDGDGLFDGGGIDFFNWDGYYSEPDPPSMPELEKQTTVSPESHNDATTTPPSQNTAARLGTGTGPRNTGTVAPLTASTSIRDVKVNVDPSTEPDFLKFVETSFLQSGFPYDGHVEPMDEPFAIAQ
ncbi:hypothetical protein CPB86DRAFT_781903 [Serendipita vermifera]|nr:hypothetical protein CPB86DRAFT_781903 [Serendipita vermifera]